MGLQNYHIKVKVFHIYYEQQMYGATSNHTIHNRRRNNVGCGGSAPNTCLVNGKQNNIMSSSRTDK